MCKNEVENHRHFSENDVECIDALRSSAGSDGFVTYCALQAQGKLWGITRLPALDAKKRMQEAVWYLERALSDIEWNYTKMDIDTPNPDVNISKEGVTTMESKPESVAPTPKAVEPKVNIHKVSTSGLKR